MGALAAVCSLRQTAKVALGAACLFSLPVTACGGRTQSSSARNDCPEVDRDGDCQAPYAESGRDCDDSDPAVHEGAPDNGPGPSFQKQVISAWQALPFPFCLAVDPSGAVHLFGGDGTGFYSTNRSGAWQTFHLEQDPPKGHCTLFVDDEAGLHLVYSDAYVAPTYARHPGAREPGAAFSHEILTTDLRVRTYDLWRSPGGRTYVAYLSEARGVWVAERTDAGWVEERVADLPGWGSVALSGSADGEPWLLTNRLRDIYAEPFFSARSGGVWTDHKLSEGATSHMALALAERHLGTPELAFQYSRHGSYGPPGRFSRVEQRTLRNGSFEGSVVDDQFWVDCMSMAADSFGVLRLALVGHGDQAEGAARELRVYERRARGYERSHREELDHAPAGSQCWPFIDASGAVTVVGANDRQELALAHNRSAPDGVDQNCDGVDGVDADGDGIASRVTGGTDDDE